MQCNAMPCNVCILNMQIVCIHTHHYTSMYLVHTPTFLLKGWLFRALRFVRFDSWQVTNFSDIDLVTIKKGLKGRPGNLGQESGQLFIGTAQTVVQLCDPLHFVKGTQIDIEGTIVASVFWETTGYPSKSHLPWLKSYPQNVYQHVGKLIP